MATLNRAYTPPRSLDPSFFSDTESLVQAVKGPVGSGKTSACVMRCFQLMQQQRPGPDGVRRSRGCVVRASYSRLDTTTLNTWRQWIPENVFRAPIKMTMPREQHLRFAMNDGTSVDCQVYFLALETIGDIEKLKSLELTWIWFHEATEILEQVFDVATDRIKRFPRQEDGGSNCWKIMLDYNPPDQEHWLYKTFEVMKPKGYRLWNQPAALIKDDSGPLVSVNGTRYRVNPLADNLEHLDATYYDIGKKSDRFVRIYYLNEYGFAENTTPVYEAYNDRMHYAGRELAVYERLPLLMGVDFGMTPAAVLAQFSPRGQLRVLDEVLPDFERGMGIRQFILTRLKPHIAQHYPGLTIRGWGDPNGVKRSDANERTCFDELNSPDGFGRGSFRPAPFQRHNLSARTQAVTNHLTRLIDGEPAFLLSSRCPMVRAGFLGKYHFARFEKAGQSGRTAEEPVKNDHSHPHDALQYLCQGIEGRKTEDTWAQTAAAVERYNQYHLNAYAG
ncbi:MAG: phage terminase large subunit [Patescibacteria group bacterium]|nr:phage terminase large subunit [Patescibacteria group bacterium]